MAIPKLRFKDFGEDWTAKKLSQVANLTSSKRVHLSDYVSEGIPFFRGKEITELKSGIFPKDILYISKKQYEDFKEKFGAPQNNEILMTAVGTLANTYLINTDFEFYFKDGNLIWFKDINADPNFLMILLDARKNDVLASAIGSTQKALTIANLNKLIFNFPSNEEQTKIASFLSAVDEKISQLTQKHALLSQYKQGMMQKLFSQQIRFKADDGGEFGEWEETTLLNIATNEKLSNGVFNDQRKVGRGYKLINVLDMYLNTTIDERRLNLLDLSEREFLSNQVKYGDIFFTRSSLVKEGIAHSNVYLGNAQDITFDGHLIKLSPKLELVDSKFLHYMLKIASVRSQLIKGGKTATMTTIGQKEVGQVSIKLPYKAEQTKIANLLSAIDQKIEVVAKQIEQAKVWKKGLLQQMFV